MLQDETPDGAVLVRLWMPRAKKPFANYRFKTKDAATMYVSEQDERLRKHKESVAARKAERKGTAEQIDAVTVGDVFHHSWGYDQTNADFYQVVAKEGRHVIVRQIASTWADRPAPSSMAAYVVPVRHSFLENVEPVKKLLQFFDGKPYIALSPHGWCGLHDGQPVYTSWYA